MSGTLSSAAWQSVWQSLSGGSPVPNAGGAPDAALLAGIAAYRRHPYERTLIDPPTIWGEGSTRLLDYRPEGGRAVLVVPSLVNRAYVLDLLPDHSMLRFLASQGLRPLLLDWGYPGEAERNFSLSDYVAGRLERVLAWAAGREGGTIALCGYCMGGLMTAAAAGRRPDLVSRMALLATPWDFWTGPEGQGQGRGLAALLPVLEPSLGFSGALGVDTLQILFSLLDPGSVAAKYRDFGTQDQGSRRALMFVALEDWLNDGIPLAAPVARETLGGWYGANLPERGAWHVLGLPVRPETLTMPCLVASPARDRIVPPESALALARTIPDAESIVPPAGHIGMVAGRTARTVLWERLASWLST